MESISKSITCILCSGIFVDAVIARCSHGFCRACFERHLRAASSSCPICNSPPLKYYKQLKKGQPAISSPPLFYYRSENLDNLVWLVLEASPSGSSERFKQRETIDHEYIKSIGLDPFSNLGLYEEQMRLHSSGGSLDSCSISRPEVSTNTDQLTNYHMDNYNDYSDFSDDSIVVKKRRKATEIKSSICDYCAEAGHDYPSCPHRSSSSESSHNEEY